MKQHPEAEHFLFENYSLSSSTLSSKKIIGDILKNVQKQVCLFKRGYMRNDSKNEVENEK